MCLALRIAACSLAVTTALLLSGCPRAGTPGGGIGSGAGSQTAGGDEDHHAHDEGPHGGHLIELGSDERYHAELVHDDVGDTVTVYLLDGEAQAAVPIDAAEVTLNLVVDGQPRQFKLPAVETDPQGKSSQFELKDAELREALEGAATGRLNVEIDGTAYVGRIEHREHDDGHEHEHEDDDEGEGDRGAY